MVSNVTPKCIEGRIIGRKDYTDTLFTLQFKADLAPFKAGQFCRIGLMLGAGLAAELVMRPYSLVNAPHEQPHEVIVTKVDAAFGGVLTPVLHKLHIGDSLYVGATANGFFSMSEVPDAQVLWGLSTGTAIGPFLSFMKTDDPWRKFEQIVLVHAVRSAVELAYREQIDRIAAAYPGRFQFIPFVSRETHVDVMSGRIPAAIIDGSLERRAGLPLNPEAVHCMLCGNPSMVADTITVLQVRGFRKHKRREPGHITTEAYW